MGRYSSGHRDHTEALSYQFIINTDITSILHVIDPNFDDLLLTNQSLLLIKYFAT